MPESERVGFTVTHELYQTGVSETVGGAGEEPVTRLHCGVFGARTCEPSRRGVIGFRLRLKRYQVRS